MEAAFFDLDKTVIAKASMVAFGRPLYHAGMINRWLIIRAMWSNLIFEMLGADEERMRKFRESTLRVTAGWDQALISAIVRDTLNEVIEPIVYDEALDLIREHQAAGRRVFIISASPEEIVAPLAQYLGVDEAIASRAELDEHGRYTGQVEFWSYGPYKAEAMRDAAARHGIDLQASYAYSDSMTDLPMLEAVGHPVVVNPDRELGKIARERGWETQWFEHRVPLRQRVNMPPPGKTLAVAGTITVLGTTFALGWWWWSKKRAPRLAPLSMNHRWVREHAPRVAQLADNARRQIIPRHEPLPPTLLGGATERVRQLLVTRPAASSPRKQRARGRRESRGSSSWRAV
jgi:HAD superfamily hydrolase (TIGR01490 family)